MERKYSFGLMTDTPPVILLDSFEKGRFGASWRFNGHVETIAAITADELPQVLHRVESAVKNGCYAAGFISYEASGVINPHLPSLPPQQGLPLAWFAVYRDRLPADAADFSAGSLPSEAGILLEPDRDYAGYARDIEQIRDFIASGDSYQVNHTFRMNGVISGTAENLYQQICRNQQSGFCCFMDTGDLTIMSASPELFFAVSDNIITTRPMKGTATRGRWPAEDAAKAAALRSNPKELAENLMIVDLLRNDLGQIAVTGSVNTESLFVLEKFPTVHQMTSTISARLLPETGLTEILRALFPCGSVTGAPKKRSMEIISLLEQKPRGIYCGAIGFIAPDGEAVFSVAIRTLLLEKQTGRITMGVGSGITWDARADSEYAECLAKSVFVRQPVEPFMLIETMRHDLAGFARLEQHLDRMSQSADFFSFRFDRAGIKDILEEKVADSRVPLRVRLQLAAGGSISVTATALENEKEPLKLGIAAETVDSSDMFRFHKTTRRSLLDNARIKRNDCNEVLFVNQRGELTEGSYNTLVLMLDGKLVTPPLDAGLLPGIMRAELLLQGIITEATLYPPDLEKAEQIWLVNSLRGWRSAVFCKRQSQPPGTVAPVS